MTVYLWFQDQAKAIFKLEEAGFTLSEYADHFHGHQGWGTVFRIDNQDGVFANLYDGECPATLTNYRVPDPVTPYNVRA